MSVVSMKRNRMEQDSLLLSKGPDEGEEEYHYGLRVSLEEPEMQKLGLENPKVGGVVPLSAIAKIVSYTNDQNGKRMELQITDMGLDVEQDREDTMYPGGS